MNDKRPNYVAQMIGYFGLFVGMQMVVSFIWSFAYAGLIADTAATMSPEAIAQMMVDFALRSSTPMMAVSGVLTIIAVAIIARRKKESFQSLCDLSFKISFKTKVLCLLMGVTANIWASLLLNLLPLPESLTEAYMQSYSATTSGGPLVSFIATVIIAPFVEEVIFRGLIFKAMSKMLPLGAAIILQGLLFGGIHGNAIWIVYASILGCILGYVRVKTGSLRGTVAMHMAFNAGSYLFGFLATRFGDSRVAIIFMLFSSAAIFLLALREIVAKAQTKE